LTLTPGALVNAGSDGETCQDVAYEFSTQVTPATATNFNTILWTHTGTGSLANATTLTPTYTPGAGETGVVTFTLTATGNGSCPDVNDQMIVTITPSASVNAGSDEEICQESSFAFTSQTISATASNYSSLVWSHTGSGTLFDGNTLTPTYFSSPSETGIITFTLTAIGNGSCVNLANTMDLLITPAPISDAGSDAEVCEGSPSFDFSTRDVLATTSNGTFIWSHNGAGTLDDASTISPVYTVDASDAGASITFTLTVTSLSAVCTVVQDQFVLEVNPAALVSVSDTDIDICEPARIELSGTVGGSASNGSWSLISGGGILSVSSTTVSTITATYDSASSDVGTTLIFRLSTNDPDGAGPCIAAFIDVNYHVQEAAQVFAGSDFAICEYDNINLNGSFSGSASSITWSGGTNNFSDAASPSTEYVLSAAERNATNLSLVFTLTTNDPPGVCPAVSDQVLVTVNDTLNFVTFVNLGAIYQEDDPAVVLQGVPPGGSFTGPGIISGTSTFNPAFADLGTNVIQYSYTDPATGCVSNPTRSTIVNPVTNIDWIIPGAIVDENGFPEICATIRVDDVQLKGFPDVLDPQASSDPSPFFSSPDIPGSIFRKVDGQFYINTKNLLPGTYRIVYNYTNSLGSSSTLQKNITVHAAPRAIIDVGNSCETSTVFFTESSDIPTNPFGDILTNWNWGYGDGNGSDSQTPSYLYPSSGNYDVRLTVTTDKGCAHDTTKVIRIGTVPIMNFTWSEFCNGDATEFTDLTNPGISNIINYEWVFDDGNSIAGPTGGAVPPGTNGGRTSGVYSNPSHVYDNFNQYNVTLTVETDDGCINSISRRIFILAYGTPTPIAGYAEDFESGPGTWVETRANNGVLIADLVATDTSWVFGLPAGSIINSAASGTNAWWTGSNPNFIVDNATYYNSEKSAVIGPCINLSDIKRPMISIDYWSDLEDQRDGAVLQYSIDGGANWLVIGDIGGAGINWYNRGALVGNPGLQTIGQYGWTGIQDGWKTARFNLDMIDPADRDLIIFRIAFGSNNDNGNPDRPYEGFAFDNIFIGEKSRNVLVEYFTNAGISAVTNDYLNNLYNNQFNPLPPAPPPYPRDSSDPLNNSDFFKIQYHIANPSADAINQENPADPNARRLYYGVSQPPAAIMDGILGFYYGNTTFNGDQTRITAQEVDRRSLEDPLFGIDIVQNATQLDSLNLTVSFDYISTEPFAGPITFHVGLVEGNLNGNINVLRKLLLGTEGVTINATWTTGMTQVIPVKSLVDVPIQDGDDLYLVAFAQDRSSKRIHQMRVVKSVTKAPATIVGVEDDPVMAHIKHIIIYPNPASRIINIGLDHGFNESILATGYSWSLIDQRGVTVLRGALNEDLSTPQPIEIDSLANGMYFMMIHRGNQTVMQRKIAVMNRH
jgi:PKD repeat protein